MKPLTNQQINKLAGRQTDRRTKKPLIPLHSSNNILSFIPSFIYSFLRSGSAPAPLIGVMIIITSSLKAASSKQHQQKTHFVLFLSLLLKYLQIVGQREASTTKFEYFKFKQTHPKLLSTRIHDSLHFPFAACFVFIVYSS